MIKYSQNYEQKYILEYFTSPESVFFLDIGAFDGRILSNTYALALRGASGVCVEPSPSVFPYLVKNYEGNDKVKLIECAIGELDGEMDLFDSGGDALSTLVEKETHQWKHLGVGFTRKRVQVKTVETLLKETGIEKVDFLSIDAEGMDFQILKQFDLKALGVKMICIECPHEKREPVKNYLLDRGYTPVYECSENLISQL